MRAYKFRAWDTENKEMLYGDQSYENSQAIADALETIMHEGCDEWTEQIELMQFTGLLGLNGKEIYEGDIVRWTTYKGRKTHTAQVAWGTCGFWVQGWLDKLDLNHSSMEVIGNIYENPELVKP